MALGECRDCGQGVSSSAATCPGCGASYPAESETAATRRVREDKGRALGVIDVAAAIVLATFFMALVWWFVVERLLTRAGF